MELSRVKKYEGLRKSLENEVKTNVTSSEVEPKAVNEAISDMVKPTQKEYTPTHEKNEVFVETIKSDELDTTFKNEYLDSFIQEVRDYNIKKGVREYEDTKLDILQQLNSKNREKRANYVESIQDDNAATSETMEISKQVFELLKENETQPTMVQSESVDVEEPEVEAKIKDTLVEMDVMEEQTFTPNVEPLQPKEVEPTTSFHQSELEERIASLESQLVESKRQSKDDDEEDLSAYTKKELVEETQKLKVQMDEYKDELEDLNTGIDSNNRLLNIIITILILALLSVIGVVVYWLISGGII